MTDPLAVLEFLLLCAIALVLPLALTGCGDQNEKPKRHYRTVFNHDIGAGHPHRMTVLNDDTEILTIGQHTDGEFLLLLRYSTESHFTIYNRDGVPSEIRPHLDLERAP